MLEYFNFRGSTTAETPARSAFRKPCARPIFDFALFALTVCTVAVAILLAIAAATQWQVDPGNVHVMDCKVEASQPGYRLVRQEDGSLAMLKVTSLLRHPRTEAQGKMLAMLMHPGAKLRVSYVQDIDGDKYVLKAVEAK